MIDIHCHVLPGLDDGAADSEQSLALARHAVADGITHIVFTPHIHPGMYDNNRRTIQAAFDAFQSVLRRHRLPLMAAMAAEVRICPEIPSMIQSDSIPMYVSASGKRTILLEFPHSHIPPGSDKMAAWLLGQGIGVLIAHPERNKDLMKNPDKLFPLIRSGCQLQITAASVSGSFGGAAQRAAEVLLQRGWVSVIASDGHNLAHRPPQLQEGVRAAAEIVGEQAANRMVRSHPRQLVGGMFAGLAPT